MLTCTHARARTHSDFAGNLANLSTDGKLVRSTNAIAIHNSKGSTNTSFELPTEAPSTAEEGVALIDRALAAGVSFVIKFEFVSEALRPLRWLSDGW